MRNTPASLRIGALLAAALGIAITSPGQVADPQPSFTCQTDSFTYAIGPDGRNLKFINRATNIDHLAGAEPSVCARVRRGGKIYAASKTTRDADTLRIDFGDSGFSASLRFTPSKQHAVAEVLATHGQPVDQVVFLDIPLNLKGAPGEPFAACALALNLKTNVEELPGPNSRLRAMCYPRFGMVGAKAALVAAPTPQFRQALQATVSAADDVPHSPLGGPWALDAEINQGSYLFNFGGLTESTADEWIRTAKACGMNQIDFHGGHSFRFGDVQFNPELYPRGKDSMRAIIDKLHAAGIKAGLHTYAFFLDKRGPYVSPVPDKRLGKDATFTLTEDLKPDAGVIPVAESTEKMSTITGFFVPNSVTLQIDDELILYTGVSKQPPFAFTGCQRGAHGTRAAAHARGAKVEHLRECFGYFLPDGDSTLFEEVAAKTAEAFNDCGFDMMYLDALDGEGVVAGPDVGWHYGSKFVFELMKRLKRPALMEMSTFHHHLWYARSRYVAWDHPNRGHKPFIDLHCKANEESRRMFLPGHLGWWAVITWSGNPQIEPTYPDDMEYLCCKALATDTGFSMMGLDPGTFQSVPAFARVAGITRQYEELRHAKYFPEAVKARLREPGKEYTLAKKADGGWTFRPVQYARHTVDRLDGTTNVWSVRNPFGKQPARLRIEALMSVGPYDAPSNPVVAEVSKTDEFGAPETAPGITAALGPSTEQARPDLKSAKYTARNSSAQRDGAWAGVSKPFTPPLNLKDHQGLGLWVHGDGQGEILSLQLRSPEHLVAGFADHYVIIDFTGWRYVELVEAEGDRCADYRWPYSGAYYDLYRENVQYDQVSSLGLWYNNLPPGEPVTCFVSPVKALPLVKAKLTDPAITIGGKKVAFPVQMESGSYLEWVPPGECRLYGPKGEVLADVKPKGDLPEIAAGENRIEFGCGTEGKAHPRARVTVIAEGEPLP